MMRVYNNSRQQRLVVLAAALTAAAFSFPYGSMATTMMMMTATAFQHQHHYVIRSSRLSTAKSKPLLSANNSDDDDDDDDDDDVSGKKKSTILMEEWAEGGTVFVTVERTFPFSVMGVAGISSRKVDVSEVVQNAWLEHHWKRGGGLPILVMVPPSTKGGGGSKNSGNTDSEVRVLPKRRTIVPVLMEETLGACSCATIGKSRSLQYTVSNPGPFFQRDLVPDSHRGTVAFESCRHDDDETSHYNITMKWDVTFETQRFRALYQAFTEFTVGTAARTVAEAVGPPLVLTLQTTLTIKEDNDGVDDKPFTKARREWLELIWARGGGLPLLPPIPYGNISKDGGGNARTSLLRIPPFMKESVLECSTTESSATATYHVENPGWATFPFLLHTHFGKVQFLPSASAALASKDARQELVDMVWEIEVRPFPIMAPFVKKLVEMTTSTIARNLRVSLAEPNSTVTLRAPRGTQLSESIDSFGSVPKETWLGGVLDAHLRDTRSTWEQTVSLFQPWSWGRSGHGDVNDVVRCQWKKGFS